MLKNIKKLQTILVILTLFWATLLPISQANAQNLPENSTPTDLTPIDPVPTDLTPIDPVPTDLTPIDPVPTDLTPIDLTPTDLTPTDPNPTNNTLKIRIQAETQIEKMLIYVTSYSEIISGQLPPGLSMNRNGAVILTGKATQTGVYEFTIKNTYQGAISFKNFQVIVSYPPLANAYLLGDIFVQAEQTIQLNKFSCSNCTETFTTMSGLEEFSETLKLAQRASPDHKSVNPQLQGTFPNAGTWYFKLHHEQLKPGGQTLVSTVNYKISVLDFPNPEQPPQIAIEHALLNPNIPQTYKATISLHQLQQIDRQLFTQTQKVEFLATDLYPFRLEKKQNFTFSLAGHSPYKRPYQIQLQATNPYGVTKLNLTILVDKFFTEDNNIIRPQNGAPFTQKINTTPNIQNLSDYKISQTGLPTTCFIETTPNNTGWQINCKEKNFWEATQRQFTLSAQKTTNISANEPNNIQIELSIKIVANPEIVLQQTVALADSLLVSAIELNFKKGGQFLPENHVFESNFDPQCAVTDTQIYDIPQGNNFNHILSARFLKPQTCDIKIALFYVENTTKILVSEVSQTMQIENLLDEETVLNIPPNQPVKPGQKIKINPILVENGYLFFYPNLAGISDLSLQEIPGEKNIWEITGQTTEKLNKIIFNIEFINKNDPISSQNPYSISIPVI